MDNYSASERKIILDTVSKAIQYGLNHHEIMPIEISNYPDKLKKIRASFITLRINDQLRGCIGSLCAHLPLIHDIVHNAFKAAFGDPRFFPLTQEEFDHLDIEVSILSELESIQFNSEPDLLQKIRPKIDGLLLVENNHRGTFLPTVWDSLPDPKTFLDHLKLKAGLPKDYWSSTIKVQRYTTVKIKSMK